jgi:hypothetical protein
MLNPESVMLNLFQHLFRAGSVQHPCLRQASNKIKGLRDPETSSEG